MWGSVLSLRLLVFVKHERVLMNLQMLMFAVTAWLKKTGVLRSSFTIIQIQESVFASMRK